MPPQLPLAANCATTLGGVTFDPPATWTPELSCSSRYGVVVSVGNVLLGAVAVQVLAPPVVVHSVAVACPAVAASPPTTCALPLTYVALAGMGRM